MQFIKHDLGPLSGGEIVEVTITNAANVRLLDSENFRKYRYGRIPSCGGDIRGGSGVDSNWFKS